MSDADKTYGERLKAAMEHKGSVLHRRVTNTELAQHAGVSRQNIGLIINGTQSVDQRLNQKSHFKVARFLRVNPEWLATGEGDILKGVPTEQPMQDELKSLAVILRSIPEQQRKAALFDAMQALLAYFSPNFPATPASVEPDHIELPQASAPVANRSTIPHKQKGRA